MATRGWEGASTETVEQFVARVLDAGVACVSYTDIGRDGTLSGPDIEGISALTRRFGGRGAKFLVAGGVGALADVAALSRVAGLDGVIIGRALYERRLDLREALKAVQD
jgi:phosphoribosylformimino-5-aminoimidazole carboxamide ribotide isomerase